MTSLLPPGVLFVGPQNKPLAANGTVLPLAVRKFFLSDGVTPATVYQDALLSTPFSPANQVTADANGRFPLIYLAPYVTYRAQLFTAGGSQLEDSIYPTSAGPQVALKPASTARANTVILTADPDLAIGVLEPGTYTVDAIIAFNNASVGVGAAFTVAYSGTLTTNFVSSFGMVGVVNGVATTVSLGTSVGFNFSGGVTNYVLVRGTFSVSAVGTVSINWAQNVSNASPTTLLKGAYMSITRLL